MEKDASEQYITCNTQNHYIKWNDSEIYTDESLRPIILNEYNNN